MKCKKIFALLLSLCMIASSFIAMPVSAATENVVDINLPIDDASELTWVASSAVTVSNADGIGGRDNVVKAEGLANSNSNTVGVKLPDGFAFADGDVLTYSIDVYSESAINPDMWLRNHGSSLNPLATFYHEALVANTWTTITKTVTFAELEALITTANSSGTFATADNYAFYLRPRTNATVYFDNFKFTVARKVVVRENVIDIAVNDASDITWTNGGVAADADGIGGRDGVIELSNLADSNGNTAGVKLPDGFAFQEDDILTYSIDVYSNGTKPYLWLRDHSDLAPFVTLYHEVAANTWTTITKTVTYAELVSASISGGSTGDFGTAGNFALYFRPNNASTVYVDNFTVTVSRPIEVRGNIIDIEADDAADMTWIASEAVTVSSADVGGRTGVIKAEGIANSNSNTVGVKLGDNFAFAEGDILTYSVDVYSESAVNPDVWLRNHTNLPTFTTFYNGVLTPNTWTTLTKTVTYDELVAAATGWESAGTYALYVRLRDSQNATVYLDNFTVTVSRKDYEPPHEHAYEGVVTTPATHTAEGLMTYTCECGDSYTEVIDKLTDHEWDEGVVTLEPTHTQEGVKTYTCPCGETKTEAIDKTADHEWDGGVVTLEPTVDAEGVKTYTCPCGETKTESIPKLPASSNLTTITVGNVETEAGKEIKIPISISNNTIGLTGLTLNFTYDKNVLTYVSAEKGTALSNLALTKPGSAYVEGDLTFNWDDMESDFSNGEILIFTFNVADDAAIGDYAFDVVVETACDYDMMDVETTAVPGTIKVKAHEHEWDAGVVTTPATHTAEGLMTYTCSTCGETKTEAIAKLADHEWDAGVVTTPATHIAEGVKTFTCICGETKTEAVAKLADHEWDAGVITTEPTHIAEGVKTYTCICGETYTEPVDKLPGHEWDAGVITTPATHITEGVKTYTCICGETYTEPVDKLPDHEWDAGVITTEPTHIAEGVKTFTCSCGETKTESVPKKADHEWDAGVVTVPATCAAEGVKTYTCPCGETKTEVIPTSDDHEWNNGVIILQPTLTAEGERKFICTVCGEEKIESIEKIQDAGSVTNVTVGAVVARAGKDITVPVSISNNTGLAGLTLSIGYDSSVLTLTGATKGDALANLDLTNPDDMSANPAVFLWDGLDADNSNGNIVMLKFKVADSAAIGVYPISVVVTAACDQTLNDVIVCANEGSVKVTTYKAGDVDDDGEVDVKDVICLRRYIVGGYSIVINEEAADVNKDGEIEIKDIVMIRRYITGGYNVELQ